MGNGENGTEWAVAAGELGRWQTIRYGFFGVLLPTLALAANYFVAGEGLFDMLYMAGAKFLLPRPGYLYVTIGSGIVTLLLWVNVFRKYGLRWNGVSACLLLATVPSPRAKPRHASPTY